MSTRAAIARWTNIANGEWAGRYHHWDGYPCGLGATLYHLVRRRVIGDLEMTIQMLVDEHPAGWSTINGADWSKQPGYEGDDKERCKKCGRSSWEHYAQSYATPERQKQLESILATLPAEKADRIRRKQEFVLWHVFEHDLEKAKGPACYCHGDRCEGPQEITQANAAGCGVEWAYVLDVKGRTMSVLEAVAGGRHSVGMFGMGNPRAQWLVRAVVFLDHPEPDWKAFG